MDENKIPEKLDGWDLVVINYLIQLRDAESENLDFKEEISDLTKHITAFANTSGGFLILGIAPIKNNIDKTISGYKKIGFKIGKEDEIGLEISNSCFGISPVPSYEIKYIPDGSVFYSVIKIQNEISKKPFFVKNKAQCFIRIDNSSRPAPRSTIMNLFGASIEYRKNIQNFQSSCILLKESLAWSINYLQGISVDDPTRPALIDLTILRNALLPAMGFVTENNLLGYRTEVTTYPGITTVIDTLEQLNAQLHVYNTTTNPSVKEDIKRIILGHDRVLAHDIIQVPKILDKIISKTKEFLQKS